MKKVLVGVFVALILVMSFGCSSEEITPPTSVTPDKSVSEQPTPAPEQPTEPAPAPAPEEETEAEKIAVTLEETEIYNANNIVVTATKIEEVWGDIEVAITVKNGSSQNILVTTEMLSVNGYMVESGMYCEVAAGKNAMDAISLYYSDLSEAGIETIADIEFYLSISDSDTYNDIDRTDLIKLSTSVAEGFIQPVDDSGEEIYNVSDVRVVCKGLKSDVIWDGAIVFFFENNTSKTVSVYAENVSVNDFMAEVSLWVDLRPGTKAVDGMYMYSLSDLGIDAVEDIEKVELAIRVINEATWEDIDTSDPIVLTFAEGQTFTENQTESDEPSTVVDPPVAEEPSVQKSDETEPTISGVRPEFKEAMDSYEAFFDEYVEFMKTFSASDNPISMMTDYAKFMGQYVQTMADFEAVNEQEMSTEEALYYAEVSTRVSQKLLEIAQ